MNSLLKLQNGTDIRGIAYENEKFDVNLTESNIRAIAKGIFGYLSKNIKSEKYKIAIGRDSRITGEKIKNILIEEFTNLGADILDADLATTPAMFMTTIWENYNCDCGIMITASHLPYYNNGFKLFWKGLGAAEKQDITDILKLAEELYNNEKKAEKLGEVTKVNLIDDYSKHLVSIIQKETGLERPFNQMKIIVDAGNGAGGFFAKKVLEVLGADASGSQFLEPDGMFPNHAPNPENKEAMEAISSAVLKNKADIGIIFDTDVDRAGIVTDDGAEINRNSLIAMISAIVLREYPNSVIVTDSITSDGLSKFISEKGGIHHRFKRGYKNVINEAKRINAEDNLQSYLAIETSGHGALKENYFLDDGTYLIAKLLIEVSKLRQEGKKLQSIIEDLEKPFASKEYRIKIKEEDFKTYGAEVLKKFEEFAKEMSWQIVNPNYEGVKANFEGGWILARMSLHEPLIATNIEVNDNILDSVENKFFEFIKEQNGLEF